jgi:SAM-dependent methyltransferase
MTKYSATDNLEVMNFAVNYNDYLTRLIVSPLSLSSRILDFGAGIGTFSFRVKTSDNIVDCFEPDISQLSKIDGVDGRYSNIDDIPDHAYDMIYSLNVFEHIQDDFEAINNLSRKLKDGGYFLIYVPAFQLLYSSMDVKVGHYRRYRRYPLERLLKRAGFIVVQSRYVDSLGFFATLAFMIIGSKVGDISIKNVTFYDKYLFPISLFLDHFFHKFFGKNVFVLCKKNNQTHHG